MWVILLNKCHTKLIHFFIWVRCRRTISMETGCQNIQLCATILKVAFSPEVIGPLYLFPLIYIVFQGGEALVFILLFRCYEAVKPKIEGKCHSWKYHVAWLFVFQFPHLQFEASSTPALSNVFLLIHGLFVCLLVQKRPYIQMIMVTWRKWRFLEGVCGVTSHGWMCTASSMGAHGQTSGSVTSLETLLFRTKK